MEYRDSMIAHTYAAWTTQSALYLLLSQNSGYSHIQGINANYQVYHKHIYHLCIYLLLLETTCFTATYRTVQDLPDCTSAPHGTYPRGRSGSGVQ